MIYAEDDWGWCHAFERRQEGFVSVFSGLIASHTCAHRNPAGRLGRALPGRVQVSLELVVLCC